MLTINCQPSFTEQLERSCSRQTKFTERWQSIFFPAILFVLEEMEKDEIVLEFKMFWAMQGEPRKLADDKFPHA